MRLRSCILVWFVVLAAFVAWGCDETEPPAADTGGGGTVQSVEGGLAFTPAWAGRWDIEVTFRDCELGHIGVVESIVASVCDRDTLSLGPGFGSGMCTGSMGDDAVHVNCRHDVDVGGCVVRVAYRLDLERDGEAVAGTGSWSTSVTAGCEGSYTPACGSFEVSAVRLGATAAFCDSLSEGRIIDPFLGARRFLRPGRASR